MSLSLRLRAVLLFALLASTFAFSADGKTLFEQGHYRQLSSIAQERWQHNPNDAEALFWLSGIYDAFGDFDRAVDYARRATEASPGSS
jgi:tetratricopeptide (TPR) repeat protein